MGLSSKIALASRLAAYNVCSAATRFSGSVWHKPKRIFFETSRTCGLRCSQCDRWGAQPRPAVSGLAGDDWLRLLSDTRAWLGQFFLYFHSAEPFADEDSLRVVEEAGRLGVYTACTTNGTMLDREKIARLCAAGLRRLSFSFDSMQAAVHDRNRGVPGTYEKALSSLRTAAAMPSRPLLQVATIVTELNWRELLRMPAWALSNGADEVNFQPLQPRSEACSGLWPADQAGVLRQLDALLELRLRGRGVANSPEYLGAVRNYYAGDRRPPGGTCARSHSLIVEKNGDVLLCPYMPPVGNVRQAGLAEIWSSPQAAEAMRRIHACRDICRVYACHFTPGFTERLRSFLPLVGRKE
ncbi:MAG: radical SAM protein [Elusimicrobia bacterium]|nr:radical SAM protein [Elusimicrobiota bacterium]